MASPYYTKQPVYLSEPSGRYSNILTKERQGPAGRYRVNTPTILNFPFTPTISIISS